MLLKDNEMGTHILSALLNNKVLNDFIGFIFENCNDSILNLALGYTYADALNIRTDNFYDHLLKREDISTQNLNGIISHTKIDTLSKISLALFFYCRNTEKYESSIRNLIFSIRDDEKAKSDFFEIINKPEYYQIIEDFFANNNSEKRHFTNFRDNEIFKKPVKGTGIQSSTIIEGKNLYLNNDATKIIDKNGNIYEVVPHSRNSIIPFSITPILYGAMIDGTFINVSELKKKE